MFEENKVEDIAAILGKVVNKLRKLLEVALVEDDIKEIYAQDLTMIAPLFIQSFPKEEQGWAGIALMTLVGGLIADEQPTKALTVDSLIRAEAGMILDSI